MHRNAARRRGLTLLEVLIALAIMGLSAAALVAMGAQAMSTYTSAYQQHARLERASALLARMSTWSFDELRARAGRRRVGECTVEVMPLASALFSVAIEAQAGPPLLRTTFYKREGDAER